MSKEWSSLSDFFQAISGENYVVLRNYETLTEDMVNSSHPDIDFLCEDSAKICKILQLEKRLKKEDGIHYKAVIAGKTTDIDLRCVGDGYYDEVWEKDILNTKKMYEGLCYVPNEEQYVYSLLYHALIQKREMSGDYKSRLSAMKSDLNVNSREQMIRSLEAFMREKSYTYTYQHNIKGIFYTKGVSRDLIEKNVVKKLKYSLICVLRTLKKRIMR